MVQPRLPAAQLAKLRADLDEMAARHAGEVGALRAELARLERELCATKSAKITISPPPAEAPAVLPAVEPAPTSIPPHDEARAVESSPPPATLLKKPDPSTQQQQDAPPAGPTPPPLPAAARTADFEIALGRVWLVRIGVVLLITGMVLLGNHLYRNWLRDLPAGVRLAFLFASALGICGAGWWAAARERLRAYGEVVLAGGLAFFHWCTYAAHHVDRLKVIDSVVSGSLAMMASAAAIVAVAVRRDSRITAVMGLLLASYSTMLHPLGVLSGVSNVLLGIAGVSLMARRRWQAPGIATLAATYAAFLLWTAEGASSGAITVHSPWFVAMLWLVFAVPTWFQGWLGGLGPRGMAWWAGVNNAAGFGIFLACGRLLDWPALWPVAGAWGAVLLAVAVWRGRRSPVMETYLVQGLGLLTLALWLRFDDWHLQMALAAEALAMAVAHHRFRRTTEQVFAVLAALTSVSIGIHFGPGPLVWSVSALLLGAAALLLRKSAGDRELGDLPRQAALVTWACAVAAGLIWAAKLPDGWSLAGPAWTTAVLTAFSWRRSSKAVFPEWHGAALAFGAWTLLTASSSAPSWIALIASAPPLLVAAAWWEWKAGKVDDDTDAPARKTALLLTWLVAFTGMLMFVLACTEIPDASRMVVILSVAGVAFPTLAHRLRLPRVRVPALLPLAVAVCQPYGLLAMADWVPLFPAIGGWLAWHFAGRGEDRKVPGTMLHRFIARGCGFFGWLSFCTTFQPEWAGDWVALSAAASWLSWHRWFRAHQPVECVGWSAVALMYFIMEVIGRIFMPAEEIPSGWGVVIALAVGLVCREFRPRATWARPLGVTAVLLTTLWASAWWMGHHGMTSITLLWTSLGAAWVIYGILRSYRELRLAGLLLLLVAVGRLFTHDVWLFGTFIRIAAFLGLGVALTVLGFFYNRFTSLLRKLVED